MLWPGPEKSCFLLDPNAGLSAGNLWRDSGPNQLEATTVNYVAPNYGIASNSKGTKYISFNGATQRATLPLRFYDRAPTTETTIVVVQRFNAPTASDFVFSAVNAAVTRGMAVDLSTAERLRIRAYDAAGAVMSCTMTADGPLTTRTRVIILSLEQSISLVRAWVDGVQVAATFAGSLNPISYDAAVVPTIGCIVGGAGNFNDCDLFLFGIDNRVWTDAEAKAFSAYWMDKV